VVCFSFLPVPKTGWLDARAEAKHMEDTWCLEGINRTPRSDGDRAWLAGTANCATLVWVSRLLDLWFPERGTAEIYSRCSFWSLLMTQVKAEAWLSLLGHHCCWPNFTKLDCWCIREKFASGSSCCCQPVSRTADFQITQTGVAPKNLLNRSTSPPTPCILSFLLPLVSSGLQGRLKCLRTIIQNKGWKIKVTVLFHWAHKRWLSFQLAQFSSKEIICLYIQKCVIKQCHTQFIKSTAITDSLHSLWIKYIDVWEQQRPWITKAIQSKKNTAGTLTLCDSRLYYRVMVIGTTVLVQKKTHRSMEHDRRPRDQPTTPNFDKMMASPTSSAGKTGHHPQKNNSTFLTLKKNLCELCMVQTQSKAIIENQKCRDC
jgi:hypothetical protein